MSDVKHTPGPWSVVPRHNHKGTRLLRVVGAAEYIRICPVNASLNAEANARLIAAAPDLLAALKPFAEIAAVFDPPNSGSRPDSGEVYVWSRMVNGKPKDFALTVEMLREARAAITRASRAGGE